MRSARPKEWWGIPRCTPLGAFTPINVHQMGFQPHDSSQQVFFLPRVYVENWLPFSYVPYYLPCPEIL